VARYHNIFGPEGSWDNGKEKAPAAVCRKVATVNDGGEIEIWGDGKQTRSFLYIDECLEGTIRLTRSDFEGPVNIGSEEMVSIDGLVALVANIAKKKISIRHIPGPTGVRGRNSDNKMIRQRLGWAPQEPLRKGIEQTYKWIEHQVMTKRGRNEPFKPTVRNALSPAA
jgi:nucleoside-diphosphate-sugar epimerase